MVDKRFASLVVRSKGPLELVEVILDGVDVTKQILSIDIHAHIGGLHQATLTVRVGDLAVEMEAAKVDG